MERDYLKAKCFGLLIPYLTYMVIDFVLIRREISAEIVFRMLYGGRAISGVYWYITCFLFTLFALGFLINHCSEKTALFKLFPAIFIISSSGLWIPS